MNLENKVRKYANVRGIYISKDQHVIDMNGCLYEPVLPFNNGTPFTQKKLNLMHKLTRWAFG